MNEQIPAIPFTIEMLSNFNHDPRQGQRWGQAFYNALPEEFLKKNKISETGHPNQVFMTKVFYEENHRIASQLIQTSFMLHEQQLMDESVDTINKVQDSTF